jgi:hypothetical protein
MRGSGLALFVLLAPPFQQAKPLHEFSALKTFRCDFTESEGRRTTAQGVTTHAKRETFSDLVVDNIDYAKRTARFIGNAGSETVQVIDGEMTTSFLEVTQTGNVNMLSIFKRTGSVITYRAAYSRHSAMTTGDLTISQSYGTCRALQ